MTYHSANEIVRHYKGRWAAGRGMCKCPAHQDRGPSLAVMQTRDGRVLVYCHAGCTQQAVIDALHRDGLWGEGALTTDPSYPGYLTTEHDGAATIEERKARDYAMAVWMAAKPAQGTPVEEYLRARGIRQRMSDELRFAPRLKHTMSGLEFRAMVARYTDARGFCGVQRTYLDRLEPKKAVVPDGKGSTYPIKLCKGPMGASAVRLRMPICETLGLAEGIETALSASQLYGFACWATLSANRLAKIEIPPGVRKVVIFGDAGTVGRKQAFAAADVYDERGLETDVVFPAAHFGAENDFNEVVKGEHP